MKRVLLLLAVVASALPALGDSITFYGSHADSPYGSGGAVLGGWERSTGNPAWGRFAGGGALSKRSAFAFNIFGWTDASTNNIVDYMGSAASTRRYGNALSGVHSQRLNLTSGGNISGHLFSNGHGRGSESIRTAVPEPETLGLLGTGLFFIGGLVRRKMKMRSFSAPPHDI
jgi:hypothetical protein